MCLAKNAVTNSSQPCCMAIMFLSPPLIPTRSLPVLLFPSLRLIPSNYSRIQHPPLLALHFHSHLFLSLPFPSPPISICLSLPLHVSQLKLYGSFTPLFLCKDNEQAPLLRLCSRAPVCEFGSVRVPGPERLRCVPSVAASVVPL